MMLPKKSWGWTKPEKPDSRKRLIATLDRWFSKYIRLRDSDSYGRCRCITCPTTLPWKEMDAGHFVSRDRKVTRYDEKNVNAQCPRCNRFRSGEQFKHGIAIDQKYGKGTADHLTNIGSVRGGKIDQQWIDYQIEVYKKKVKELEKKHCTSI